MPTPITVVIHFAGIIAFSNQVPNDCGIKAIAPKEFYVDPRSTIAAKALAPAGALATAVNGNSTANRLATVTSDGPQPHVEDHVLILAFPADSHDQSINWGSRTILPGNNPNNYQYVTLDGERIRFETGIQNQAASLANIKLPPLHDLCVSMASLNANFQPPYRGAAAVFDLPQGDVKACMVGAQQRIDTELSLQSNGFLTISASTMRATKEIRLKPSSLTGKFELIVANVPLSCLTNGFCSPPNQNAIDSVPHVHAYYEMGAGQSATCNTSITAWFQANQTNPLVVPTNGCAVSSIPDAAGGFGNLGLASKPTDRLARKATDFECSNSRFP